MYSEFRLCSGALALAILLSLALAFALGTPNLKGMSWGWALALANMVLAFRINHRAIGAGPRRFLIWAVGLNALRVIGLLAVILVGRAVGGPDFSAFLLALGVGYFVFLGAEILWLHGQTTGGLNFHE